MSTRYDVIIVGAGIVGAACALACARRGLKVLVADRGPVGAGATAAGMGHLVVMDDSEAQFALTEYGRRLWRALAGNLPADVEYDPCGTLWVAADDEEMQEVLRKHAYYTSRGVAAEVLDGAEVARREPVLRSGLAGALRVPEDSVIYPPCAARFLIEQARALGVDLATQIGVARLLLPGGVVLTDDTALEGNIVVLATGAAAGLVPGAFPVKPRKGHLVITDRVPGFVRHQIVELGYLKSAHTLGAESVAFNIQPRKTGQMLIGSSRQFDTTDGRVEHGILKKMLARACDYIPTLGELSAIRAWTGFRAATPDKLPLVGPVDGDGRIWLATGHEGLGITTSLATGEILADRLTGGTPAIDPAPYDPARFLVGASLHV